VSQREKQRASKPSATRRLLGQLAMLPRLAAACAPGVGRALARRRWPRTSGEIRAAGLRAPVEIVRDRWGVPHLYARDEHDLLFAQGYAHAQDRLWQMEFGRRAADGRLSELLGPAALPADRLLRTLGLRLAAERCWSRASGDARALVDAYTAGVNARIAGEPPPLEFAVFGAAPAPWSAIDILARGNLLAFALGGNHRLELLRARLLAEAGEEVAAELLPPHAPDTPIIAPPEARAPGLRGKAGLDGLDVVDGLLGDPNIVSGSNNWVVHGGITASGKPLLANDVHIGLGLPSTWYANGLHGGRLDVVGFSLPGVPFVVIGHNRRIAWGMSNLGPDTQDFYLERLDDAAAPTRYEYRGQWCELEVRRERIAVRGGSPVDIEVHATRHGPIMNRAMGKVLADAEPMALRWALHDSDALIAPLLAVNLAGDWDAFRTALRGWDSPGQNFVYADVDGNIGYQATGKIPVRAPGHTGMVPVPGWTGEHEWQGFIPFDELPRSFNPPAGFVATANNKITDPGADRIATSWFPGYRARRIVDCLAASRRHDVASMRAIQAETTSLPAQALVPTLLAAVQGDGLDEPAPRALAELAAWDFCYETDRIGATVFQAWYIAILRELLGRKLGPDLVERYLASEYERHGSMHMPLVIRLMGRPDDPWFADASGRGSRDELIGRAFAAAIEWLCQRHGRDPDGWRWGQVHTLTYRHQPLGRSGPGWVRRAFNTRTVPARGDNYTVDGASFLWSAPFEVVHGTALRMVVDLADFSASIGVHAPGQSEHLHHPHRDDLLELSHRQEYFPLLYERSAVDKHARARLGLTPR
jgi:penicillin amidase